MDSRESTGFATSFGGNSAELLKHFGSDQEGMAGGDEGKALDPARDLERAYRFHEGIEPKCSILPLRREKDYPHHGTEEINDEARRLMFRF